jgi:hypothetical protein
VVADQTSLTEAFDQRVHDVEVLAHRSEFLLVRKALFVNEFILALSSTCVCEWYFRIVGRGAHTIYVVSLCQVR